MHFSRNHQKRLLILRVMFLPLLALLPFGCSHTPVKSIQVDSFDTPCPQPEADMLASRIPDLIAKDYQEDARAGVVSREQIEKPDYKIQGSILGYQPASGLQFCQGKTAILKVEARILRRMEGGGYDQIGKASYTFETVEPSEGILFSGCMALGVLIGRFICLPVDAIQGFPTREESASSSLASDLGDKLRPVDLP